MARNLAPAPGAARWDKQCRRRGVPPRLTTQQKVACDSLNLRWAFEWPRHTQTAIQQVWTLEKGACAKMMIRTPTSTCFKYVRALYPISVHLMSHASPAFEALSPETTLREGCAFQSCFVLIESAGERERAFRSEGFYTLMASHKAEWLQLPPHAMV